MAVPAKYAHIDFSVTKSMQENARRALEARQSKPKSQRGMTAVGIARARDISNGVDLSPEVWRRVANYFPRHEVDKGGESWGEQGPGWQAWNGWGGDEGWARARKIVRQMDAADKKAARGLAREWSQMDAPKGLRLHNPKALRVGSAFRTLTADEAVRCESTGDVLGRLGRDDLAEMARVFYAQCDRQEGAPRVNYNHGPSRSGRPDIYGEVIGLFVADDGKRGSGLYVVPGWTEYGAEFVAKHKTPDGGSVLSNSPEFSLGPVFARGGDGEGGEPVLLGAACFLGVALTPTPQQDERIIDPVRLARGADKAPGPERNGMEADERPDGGGMYEKRMEAFEDALQVLNAKVDEKFDAIMERMAEMGRGAEMGADAPKSEMATEAVDALALSVDKAADGLSVEQRAELSRRVSEDDAKAIAGDDATARAVALSRKLEAIGQIRGEGQVAELSRQVDALRADAISAKVDAERARLRQMGGSAERVERMVGMFTRKLEQPKMWTQVNGDACPYEMAVADLKARPDVELGKRSGVSAEVRTTPRAHTMSGVVAWAKEHGVEGGAIDKARAYCAEHGINHNEIGEG